MAKKIGLILFLIGVVNFLCYGVISVSIGGSAIAGEVVDGRYYVSDHGKKTEVSAGVFTYSKVHGYSLWVTHPLAMMGLAIFGAYKAGERAQIDSRYDKKRPKAEIG